jgi:hypothetical protein
MLALVLTLALSASAAGDPPAAEACVPADDLCEVIDPATGRPRTWPADVQDAEDDAFACIHFGGEPSGDPERQAFLEREMKKACNGLHHRLPGLKRKYRKDPVVTQRLANIEAYYGGPIP